MDAEWTFPLFLHGLRKQETESQQSKFDKKEYMIRTGNMLFCDGVILG